MKRELKHILVLAVIVCSVVFMRCANQLTPQGGPKDSLPPVVKLATPAFGKRHFTDRRIFIEFNEYVQLKDQAKEFFTSPRMKTKPVLAVRGRGVRIDIKDTLLENQTYALNFGSAIADNNEGNVLSGFRYVFSTGSAIDSMLMTGYTADAMKGDSISKTFIFFYDAALVDSVNAASMAQPIPDSFNLQESDSLPVPDGLGAWGFSESLDTLPRLRPYTTPEYDSLLFLGEPGVVARAEGNGIFIAQNLKDIPYRVYAVDDKNNNQKYDPGDDKVGFLDSVCNPAEMEPIAIWLDRYRHYPTADPQVYFRMFGETPQKRQNLAATERPGRHQAILRFSAPFPRIDTLLFDSIPQDRVIREYMTPGRDTISLWFDMPPEALGDTIKGRISYWRTDSLGVLAPTSQPLRLAWQLVETREQEREREREERDRQRAEEEGEEYIPPVEPNPFRFKVDAGAEVNPEKSIPIQFDLPLVTVDSARISLLTIPDLGDPQPFPFHIVRDTMNVRLWTVTADWDEQKAYRLIVPAGAFVNIAGERNDSLGANFKIMQRSDFATLAVNVTGKTPEANYILQIVDAGGKIERELARVSTGRYYFYYIPEGEVRLRVTEDGNGNGKWDTGSLVARRQPERVEFYVGPTGDQFVPTRLNWEVEANLDMAQIFSPVSIEKIRADLQRAEDIRVAKYLEEKAERDAQQAKEAQQGANSGGLGIGGALGSAKQQMQTTIR